MNAPAAFQGNYADIKVIKTRSVAQIHIEIPLEQAEQFVAAFGMPCPGAEKPVAIARLVEAKVCGAAPRTQMEPEQPKERRRFEELSPSQQAGIACNEVRFQRYMFDEHSAKYAHAEDAATAVRRICDVKSRADLNTDGKAANRWAMLYSGYLAWLRVDAA